MFKKKAGSLWCNCFLLLVITIFSDLRFLFENLQCHEGRPSRRRPSCKTLAQQRPRRNEYDDHNEAELSYCQRGRGKYSVTLCLGIFLLVLNLMASFLTRINEEKRHKILSDEHCYNT